MAVGDASGTLGSGDAPAGGSAEPTVTPSSQAVEPAAVEDTAVLPAEDEAVAAELPELNDIAKTREPP